MSDLYLSPSLALEESVYQYNKVLSDLLEKHAPLKVMYTRMRPKAPWYSDTIITAKKLCRKAERKWRRTKLTVDRVAFQQLRNDWNSAIKVAKSDNYKGLISESSNPKQLFGTIEELLHQKGKAKLPANISSDDLRDKFNDYFRNKIETIQASLGGEQVEITEHHLTSQLNTFEPTTEEEILKTINESPTKSTPMDPIPTWLLKMHLTELIPTITKIVNMSLEEGIFPESMKYASVHPLLKKSTLDPEQYKNYRPVSNLTFLSKLLERIVSRRLSTYMDMHSLYEATQSAYRVNHGTETVLTWITNYILCAMDERKGTYLVLLDLSAAFDTIHHGTLLHRLNMNLGVNGTALQWIRSYLTDRRQRVIIQGVSSQPTTLTYGVPQGSVLGPKLFTIYSAPIATICRNHNLDVQMYADDTQLLMSFDVGTTIECNDIRCRIENCIEDLRIWMKANHLKLNDDKTELLVVISPHHQERVQNSRILVGSNVVESSTSARDLGIVIDSTLNMEKHVSSICKSAYHHLRNINAIRKSLDTRTAEILIHAFVTSRLDCGNAVLAGLPKHLIAKLQVVQNSAARVVLKIKKSDHITPALHHLHWLPIEQRIDYKILLLTWKALHGQAPGYMCDLVVPYNPTRSLRSQHAKLLVEPRFKSNGYGGRAFSRLSPRLWNSLPQDLRKCDSLEPFKKRLKTYLFQGAYEVFTI